MATGAKMKSGSSSSDDYGHIRALMNLQYASFKSRTQRLPIDSTELLNNISSRYALHIERVQQPTVQKLNQLNKEFKDISDVILFDWQKNAK